MGGKDLRDSPDRMDDKGLGKLIGNPRLSLKHRELNFERGTAQTVESPLPYRHNIWLGGSCAQIFQQLLCSLGCLPGMDPHRVEKSGLGRGIDRRQIDDGAGTGWRMGVPVVDPCPEIFRQLYHGTGS